MPEQRASIGRFEITGELGRGSMGIVHRAHDPLMGRDVALKTILLPHGLLPAKREEFHQRFLREAQAAGRLSHPGIVTVYDFNDGATTGSPFIAMEYVEGRTLHELLHDGRSLDPSWVLALGQSLADALQTAHDAGIVHRDLKPANILVRETDGVAKITDFGVARVNHSELTGAGLIYGSPAYMAPERLRGAPADARSDLYALGVILYELLVGKRPFDGDDFASICAAILNGLPPSIHQLEPRLSPAFDRFFARALAKNPDDRFENGAAFRDALRALQDEQAWFVRGEATAQIRVPTDPVAPRSSMVAVALGLIALLLLVVFLADWATPRPPEMAPPPPRTAARQVAAPTTAARLAPAPKPTSVAKSKSAHLDLHVKNRLKAGTLTLFVDGKQVYATALAAEEQSREEISAGIDVAPGRHKLLAQVVRPGKTRRLEQSLSVKIEAGATPGLSIEVGRKVLGPLLTLTLE